MVDLNDLRTFERVAAFRSFSEAAKALGLPKSSISRSIGRLEEQIGIRLFQRSSRMVQLTTSGETLLDRCSGPLAGIGEAIDQASSLSREPAGVLRISAGIGFGINILSRLIPEFLARYPKVNVAVDLTSREADLVAERVDVAIRMGPMESSELIATRLGALSRCLCVAPEYVARRGLPTSPYNLAEHDCIEMPGRDGRARSWKFSRAGRVVVVDLTPRISVNDALTIHQMIRNGSGIGVVSGYLCRPDLENGTLVHVCSEWTMSPLDVTIVYPSRRELSPVVRAFVDHLRIALQARQAGCFLENDFASQ